MFLVKNYLPYPSIRVKLNYLESIIRILLILSLISKNTSLLYIHIYIYHVHINQT